MEINKNYKIESDNLNVTLYRRADGKKNWIPIGYFSNPNNALNYLMNHEITGTGMVDLKTVCDKINELTALVNSVKSMPALVQCLPRPAKGKRQGNIPTKAV